MDGVKMAGFTLLDKIFLQLIQESEQRGLEVNRNFLHFFTHLLLRDARLGLNINKLNECKIQRFLDKAIELYTSDLDPTMCNFRMTYAFKRCTALQLDIMKEIYEVEFQEKLHNLVQGILQYPETSNDKQLDEILYKIQVFIIAAYNIGDPKNHVLLKQTRQSVKSVLSHGDLQNFVRKKRYHRLEYLQRLTATVCGILIYNNCDPTGDKENMRDVLADIAMAKKNTKDSIDAALNDINEYIAIGIEAMNNIITLDTQEKKITCKWPIDKVREINKYVALFKTYEYLLKQIVESFQRTEYRITVDQKKMDCIIEKIHDLLQYRTAIESQMVFPHFKYLTELWTTLQLYLNHLAEMSKLKDALDACITDELKQQFRATLAHIAEKQKILRKPTEPTFNELQQRTNKVESGAVSMQNIKEHFGEYCALTMALTNGLLLPANLQKKLCEDLQLRFGFAHIDFAKYAERHYEDFVRTLKNAIYTSVDLILLFDLQDEILQQDFDEAAKQCETIKQNGTQTEMVVQNDVSASNWINVTWNAWDFHRETVHRANLRKKQTHSQQTTLSYGVRNAQNQSYSRKDKS